MTDTSISIALVTFNQAKLLDLFLERYVLLNHDLLKLGINIPLLVVNDGSTDKSELIVNKWIEKGRSLQISITIFTQKHRGIAAARNQALQYCGSSRLAFTDTDCIIDKDYLIRVHQLAILFPLADAIEGRVLPDGVCPAPFYHGLQNLRGGAFVTANMVYKVASVLEVNGFDENYGNYREDVDLGLRLSRDHKLVFDSALTVTHPWLKRKLLSELKGLWPKCINLIRSERLLYSKHPDRYEKVRYFSTVNDTIRSWLWKPFLHSLLEAYCYRKNTSFKTWIQGCWNSCMYSFLFQICVAVQLAGLKLKDSSLSPGKTKEGIRKKSVLDAKPRVFLLWTGAVSESYLHFLTECANEFELLLIAPHSWKHGSVVHITTQQSSEKFWPFKLMHMRFLGQGNSLYFVPGLLPQLWKKKPDIFLMMDEWDRFSTLFHFILVKIFSRKTRLVFYSLQNIEKPSYYRWWHQFCIRSNSFLSDAAFVASPLAKKFLNKRSYNKLTQLAAVGASHTYFRKSSYSERVAFRKVNAIAEDARVLVYTGSISTAKGFDTLHSVILKLNRQRFKSPLLLCSAGNGPLVANSRLEENPFWHHFGALDPEQLIKLYQSSDYVILPSIDTPFWKEQVGRSLVEGIFCGCLALGSNSGNIPHIVQDSELCFQQNDRESLEALLLKIPFKNENELKKKQYQFSIENYSEIIFARKLSMLVQKLMNSNEPLSDRIELELSREAA